jgi:hypothetical protein
VKKLVRYALAVFAALVIAPPADAAKLETKRIDIQYVAPKKPEHRALFEMIKEKRALERMRDLLSPMRLPRRLVLRTDTCDEANAWYDETGITVCYEFFDEIWKNAAEQTTPAGIAPIDTLVGPLFDVFLHEFGHAIFDMLKIPVLGREEDAADYFSAYIMLQFNKDEARRLIAGNAYQYKSELKEVWTQQRFANEHSTPAQRLYNVLCLAYGADEVLFRDVVDKDFLPKERAEYCKSEYAQIAFAFDRLIRPYIDRKLARRLHKPWLPPVTVRPPSRTMHESKPQ